MSDKTTLDNFTDKKTNHQVQQQESVFAESPKDWEVSNLSNPRLFKSTSSGLETFSNSKIYIPTAGVEDGQIVDDDGHITYDSRPSRANLGLSVGDVIFAKMKDSIKVLRASKELAEGYVFSTGFIRISLEDNVNTEYFKQVLLSSEFNQRKDSLAIGSTQPAIRLSDLSAINIPIPPIHEQRKIATVLYTVDRAIEKTEEIISQIESVLSGVTEELLIGGYGEKEFQQNRIYSFEFQMPTDWEVVEIHSLNKDSKPICYGIVQPGDYHEGGIPILNIEHSRYGDEIDVDELHRVSTQLHEKYSRSKLTGGEIVISVKGSTGDVGKVPSNIDEWNISRDLARISPNDEINRDWLRFYLSTELAQKFIHVNSPGSTRDSLNIGDLKQLPILLPPQDEQDQIADVVADIEDELESENQYLNQLQRLKRGLMQDLLSGTVRTTDTNIEVPEEIAQYG